MADKSCRSCGAPLEHSFVDLGMSPLANRFLGPEQLGVMEPFYPLHARVCGRCFLVQVPAFETPEAIFGDYAYFSSYSETWLRHAQAYCEMARRRFRLGAASKVVEIASNDGYLLRNFRQASVPVLGVEPARNIADVAEAAGIPTMCAFFGRELAERIAGDHGQADLIVANNVLAHVPDLNDFIAGMARLLAPGGAVTIEFPHLLRLIAETQFDTIYHEHFSYFSLLAARQALARHGLALFDVEELPTHGGSLRVYAGHEGERKPVSAAVEKLQAGLDRVETYAAFQAKVREAKWRLVEFLVAARRAGKRVAGYGAAAKGNTLLNYCGIGGDLVEFVADASPHKQGKFLPGTHIPVVAPEQVRAARPDYLLILAWNLADEIMGKMGHIRQWGGRFVLPVPAPSEIA